MSIKLSEVVPFGRSRREYELMFNLSEEDKQNTILGCGDGPASFNAEMTQEGYSVISVDPIYAFSGIEIQSRFNAVIDDIMNQIKATPEAWIWGYHRDVENLRLNRIQSMNIFLADYEKGKQEKRYQVASVPHLPFSNNQFKLALCSHLLFLYSNLLSLEFHIQSVEELCRVATEVRIFPLLTLSRDFSPYVEGVREAMKEKGINSEIERVGYEFQKGGNKMIRFFR